MDTVDKIGQVWVLEDSPLERRLITEALAVRCDLTMFTDGTGLIEALAYTAPAVLVLDWMLPGMSGLDVSKFVRESRDKLELPILMLTANASDESLLEGLTAGANDFVTKPFRVAELLARVETLATVTHLARTASQRDTARIGELRRQVGALAGAANRELRQKDHYIGILGHDLRNPLNAILTSTELLGRGIGNPTRNVERVRRSAQRMAMMIRDLLDFSRGSLGGGLPLTRGEVDLPVVCEHIIDELTIANAGRQISSNFSGDLRGWWDQERLQQAISNLLGNALEHSEGPVTLEITGGANSIHIAVHNSGTGISAAELPVLFEPFRKREGQRSGLGLGLYIVKEVAAAHGGTVSVTSVPNDHTTFTMILPRTADDPSDRASNRPLLAQ